MRNNMILIVTVVLSAFSISSSAYAQTGNYYFTY
jgi:hypothetical protein